MSIALVRDGLYVVALGVWTFISHLGWLVG